MHTFRPRTLTAPALVGLALFLTLAVSRIAPQAMGAFQSPLPPPPSPCLTQTIDGFTLDLYGYVNNEDGTTTITYHVTNDNKKDISYAAFGLGDWMPTAPGDGATVTGDLGDYHVEWTNDRGNPGFASIKYETEFDGFSQSAAETFAVAVSGFDASDSIQVQLKAGNARTSFTVTLSEANCDLSPTPTPTATPQSPLPTPTALPGFSTPTPLPDVGIHLGEVTVFDTIPEIYYGPGSTPRFINPATDGGTIVGISVYATESEMVGAVIAIDIETGESQMIAEVASISSSPQVSERFIVWNDKTPPIRFYDRTTGQLGAIELGDLARYPSLSDSVLVWKHVKDTSISGGEEGIWGYDLPSHEAFPVVTGRVTHPMISQQWVIYRDLRAIEGEGYMLIAKNLDDGRIISLGPITEYLREYVDSRSYAIEAPWVAWSTNEWNDTPELHLYNLETGQASVVNVPECGRPLSDNRRGRLTDIEISGSLVLFKGCYQTLGYEIGQGVFFSLPLTEAATPLYSSLGWDFSNGQLVWIYNVGTKSDYETHIFTAPVIID